MFEGMVIVKNIYEGVVEPYYKKSARLESNRNGHKSYIKGIATPLKSNSNMGRSGKIKRINVDRLSGELELTCLIYGPVHSS